MFWNGSWTLLSMIQILPVKHEIERAGKYEDIGISYCLFFYWHHWMWGFYMKIEQSLNLEREHSGLFAKTIDLQFK